MKNNNYKNIKQLIKNKKQFILKILRKIRENLQFSEVSR